MSWTRSSTPVESESTDECVMYRVSSCVRRFMDGFDNPSSIRMPRNFLVFELHGGSFSLYSPNNGVGLGEDIV